MTSQDNSGMMVNILSRLMEFHKIEVRYAKFILKKCPVLECVAD